MRPITIALATLRAVGAGLPAKWVWKTGSPIAGDTDTSIQTISEDKPRSYRHSGDPAMRRPLVCERLRHDASTTMDNEGRCLTQGGSGFGKT